MFVVLVAVSSVLGNDDTILKAKLEFIMTKPSCSIILSGEVDVLMGRADGVIILIGPGLILEVLGFKFCPRVFKLSMGINVI